MKALAAQRLRNATITFAVVVLAGLAVYLHHLNLRDTGFLTGWMLVAAFVILAAYNLRKKLPFLPLAKSATWLRLHAWLGLATVAVFFMHAGIGLPDGGLDTILWLLFVGLLVTGIVGITISRLAPRPLTEHGERVIFERIPRYRAQLAREMEELVTDSLREVGSVTIATHYARRLRPFFARPRHLLYHLCGSKAPIRRLCRELRELERFLSEEGRKTLDEIEARVSAKDNLDYHYAWQGLLKGWLFLHIPLTWAAAVVVAVHVVLAYAFAVQTP
jgi:hypothetical protein